MKTIAITLAKIAGGYAVLNTIAWAAVGFGCYLDTAEALNGTVSARDVLFRTIEKAVRGFKNYKTK